MADVHIREAVDGDCKDIFRMVKVRTRDDMLFIGSFFEWQI